MKVENIFLLRFKNSEADFDYWFNKIGITPIEKIQKGYVNKSPKTSYIFPDSHCAFGIDKAES